MWKNRLSVLLVLVSLCFASQAQVNRYMIFFADKDTAAYEEVDPLTFLSQKSINRRTNQEIDITAQDYPVTHAYVDSLFSLDVDVYFKSRWFNGVLVQMNSSKILSIQSLGFVTEVEYIAPESLLERNSDAPVIPENFLEPPTESANSSLQLGLLNADLMHDDGFRGEGMIIAVFDNGFSGVNEFTPFQHVFDDNRLVATRDFTHNSQNVFQFGSHGTQVFSCIGANYGDVLVGTAPEASFVLCVTEAGKEYRVEEYNWLMAAEFADSLGVDVINSSLGYSTFDDANMDYSLNELDGKTTVVTRAASIAAEKGIIVVASAGNEGRETNSWRKVTAPADADDILSVGSVNTDGSKTSFSSFGPTADGRIKPDVCALGNPTAVMKQNGNISKNTGTSFSSPLMAGFAACIWQANPNWTYQQVIQAIKNSGSNALNPDTAIGYGVPNYKIAVNGGTLAINDILNSDIKVFPNPFKENKITIDLQNTVINDPLKIQISNLEGKSIFEKKFTERTKPAHIEVEFDAERGGIYLLTLESRNLKKIIKLVKI